MKATKILYWVLTGVVSLMMLYSGYAYLNNPVYAGFGITFVSAFIAHTASGDPLVNRVMTLLFLALLTGSYLTYHKLQAKAA